MTTIDKEQFEYRGFNVTIQIHHDEDMGPPWKEDDGHGPVSGWRKRDSKRPGERVLIEDHNHCLFYDFAEACQIAKRDGWSLSDEGNAKIASRLGRKPTAEEIRVATVEQDFAYCRGFATGEWHWLGYTTVIANSSGDNIEGDSCWGFDDSDYMLKEAKDNAEASIDTWLETAEKTLVAECYP